MSWKAMCRWSGLALCCWALIACQNTPSSSSKSEPQSLAELTEPAKQQEVSLQLSLSAALKQVLSSSKERHVAFTAADVFDGTLSVDDVNDGLPAVDHPWTVGLNDSTFDVESLKQLVLEPGTYNFDLTVMRGAQQYHAELFNHTIVEGANTLPLTLRPVIGDTLVNVSSSNFPSFQFQYDPNELSLTNFNNPQIGVRIDGGSEQLFALNLATGLSSMFLNLSEEPHTIELRLYEGALQRGRSIAEQESITVVAGLDIAMDLVALQGGIEFTLDVQSNDAQFDFNIPHEIIDEAGGLANLSSSFSVVGNNTPFQENPLTLSFVDPDYTASITLPNFQYDTLTLTLNFEDTSISPNTLIGSCSQDISLQNTNQTVLCNLALHRRAVVSGNLLATVGISVLDETQLPVGGATVLANGQPIGMTSDGTVGVAGHLKAFLLADQYSFRAENTTHFGTHSENVLPLDVQNIEIILDQLLPPPPNPSNTFGGSASDIGRRLAIDSSQFVYMTGRTESDLDGPGSSFGGRDGFLAKFDSGKNNVWARPFGTDVNDDSEAVAVDSAGNIYAAGATGNGGDFAGDDFGGSDIIIIKYNSAGNVVWKKQYGSELADTALGIAIDSAGDVFVTGFASNDLNDATNPANPDTGIHAFLMKLNSSGNPIWTRLFGAVSPSRATQGNDVVVDSAGNIYVAGYTHGDLAGVGDNDLGAPDAILAKYNSSGTQLWIRQWGLNAGTTALSLILDSSQAVYVTGETRDNLEGPNAGHSDVFLTKFNSAGTQQWMEQFGSNERDFGRGLAIDSSQFVYIVGETRGALPGKTHQGQADAFIAKYDNSGNQQWLSVFGNGNNEVATDAVVDSSGSIFVSGWTDTNTGELNADALLLKYDSSGNLQ